MAKESRFQKSYRANASKLHKEFGDLLRSHPSTQNYKIYQEYPVNRINPTYHSGREKFDWVVIDLQAVIEVHGQQHYQPVRFGGISEEEAAEKYVAQLVRDKAKKKAAEEAGWTYIVFKYDEPISMELFLKKFQDYTAEFASKVPDEPVDKPTPKPQRSKPTESREQREARLQRQREHRKEQYQRRKEWWAKRRGK